MKTFGKYFLITILLLLGLCCIGVLYLFFFPNSNLFGLTYIHNNITVDSKAYSLDDYSLTKVVVKNNNYNVNISKSAGNTISAQAYSNSYGFGLVKNKNLLISTRVENEILYITVTEPTGALVNSKCYVNVKIPESTLDLEVSNHNAKTTFTETKVDDFIYTANNGQCLLTSGEITNNITAKLNYSSFNISKDFKFNKDVNLSLDKGQFTCLAKINDINVIENDRGVLKASEINNLNFEFETAGGNIYIEKANNCTIISSDTNVNIKQTNSAKIDLTKTGNISIQEISTTISFLTTNSGNIYVSNCKANLQAKSTSGNIKIDNAYRFVDATNVDGNITVNYDKIDDITVPDYNSSDLYRKLQISLTNGNANITGAQNIQATIYGKGNINLTTDKILANDNKITVNKGSLFLVIKDDAWYTLQTESTTHNGNISVNLLGISNVGTNGYSDTDLKSTPVNESYYTGSYTVNSNLIDIKCTSGSITVRDTKTVNL